jgi:sugar/nucleoside kinase (ribokinase family)
VLYSTTKERPMDEPVNIIVAGHICLDIIPDLSAISQGTFDQYFRPGHLIETGPVTLSTGGAVSNTGLALHRLGVPTQLMGKVGDDLLGRAVLQIVASHGAELVEGMVVDGRTSTSHTVIISPPGVDRIFLHCPGANDTFGAAAMDYDAVAGARLFHFGYPPIMRLMYEDGGEQLVEMFRRVKTYSVTTSLDMALPDPASAAGRVDWITILRALLPYVDVFLPSIEEILFMLRREVYEELLQATGENSLLRLVTPALLSDVSCELLAIGGKVVGFKLGDRGLYVRTADRPAIETMGAARPSDASVWAGWELWTPCFQVDVAGTTGAGDATIAGFLAGLLRDLSPEEAVTAAVAVGACNVETADAVSGVRPWDEMWHRVKDGWMRHALSLDAPGWCLDPRHHLWTRSD